MKAILTRRTEITCLLNNLKQADSISSPKYTKPATRAGPIVSANAHFTEKISEFVDLHL